MSKHVATLLAAAVAATGASAQVVFEADLGVTRHVIRQPANTISEFFPKAPAPGFRQRNPFVTHFCLWNTFGSDPAQPEREIYEESPTGEPIYRFDRLTVHIDGILAEGLIPYLVLGSCPLALTTQPYRVSYEMGVVTTGPRPNNWDKYRTFVKDLFLHLNAKYGAQNVASWKYRFMSEPDCTCWWTEGPAQYFKFFDYTVSGARLANPGVRIAPGNFLQTLNWLTTYAERFQSGTFSVPGESSYVPPRFCFTYYEPWRVGEPAGPALFQAKTQSVRATLAQYSVFSNIPLALDEGFVGQDESKLNMWSRLDGSEWGGAHFLGLLEVMINNNYEQAILWNPDIHDCPTPVRHVLNWAHSINGARLLRTTKVSGNMRPDHTVTTLLARRGQSLSFLLGHAAKDRTASGNQDFRLNIKGLTPGKYRVTRQRADATHGNYKGQWLADHQGYPHINSSKYDQDPLSGLAANSPARQIWAQNFSTYQALAADVHLGSSIIETSGTTLTVPTTLPTHAVEFIVIDMVEGSSNIEANPSLSALASYESYGASCAVIGSRPTLQAGSGSRPRTGSTMVTEIKNLPAGSQPYLFMGLSSQSWRGIPLPLELSIISLPGCRLLTSDDLVIPLLNAAGTATLSLNIPLNSQLHGAVYYNQALVFGPGFQPMSVSNGAKATIGQ